MPLPHHLMARHESGSAGPRHTDWNPGICLRYPAWAWLEDRVNLLRTGDWPTLQEPPSGQVHPVGRRLFACAPVPGVRRAQKPADSLSVTARASASAEPIRRVSKERPRPAPRSRSGRSRRANGPAATGPALPDRVGGVFHHAARLAPAREGLIDLCGTSPTRRCSV